MNPVAQAHEAGRRIKPWVEYLARAGYAAKGIVYILVGSLALQAALGRGGQTGGPKDALLQVLYEPFGKILLGIITVGLIGYALTRFIEAATDPDNLGTDKEGIVKRIGYAVSGVIYSSLAIWTTSLLFGSGNNNSNQDSTQTWSATLMEQPYGRWMVGLVGVIVIGVALHQFYDAYSAQFQYKFKHGDLSAMQREWAIRIGRFGHAARGVAFAMIGYFFIQAAITHNPNEAGGLGKALQELASQPHGPWLMGFVSAGLICYGIYSCVEGWLRRFNV